MGKIYIIGLGPGSKKDLTLEAVERMEKTPHNYLRTQHHPTVEYFHDKGIDYISFDEYYEEADSFEEVYEKIAQRLIEEARTQGDINYFVPGHPLVAERVVEVLVNSQENIEIVSGISFIEPILELVGKDPVNGLQIIDGLGLRERDLDMNLDTIITQVYSKVVISNIKLSLSEVYGDEYKVYYIQNAGLEGRELVEYVSIYQLDRELEPNLLTSLYIPRVGKIETRDQYSFKDILEIMERLRAQDGCPWDRKQTHQSIRSSMIEEAYEAVDAIDSQDIDNIVEELGDVLFQVVFHSQIGYEEGSFNINQVLSVLGEKLIYRHPHVFSEKSVEKADKIVYNWNELKYEKREIRTYSDRLKDIKGLPSLLTSYKVQKEAAKVGFDWEDISGPIDKVEEEYKEVLEAIRDKEEKSRIEEEIGDILFSIVNLSRFLEIDPEVALNRTINKFVTRFEYIEKKAIKAGRTLDDMDLEEMDKYWNESKSLI